MVDRDDLSLLHYSVILDCGWFCAAEARASVRYPMSCLVNTMLSASCQVIHVAVDHHDLVRWTNKLSGRVLVVSDKAIIAYDNIETAQSGRSIEGLLFIPI